MVKDNERINEEKAVSIPGYAPYLDYRSVNEGDRDGVSRVENLLGLSWLRENLESEIIDYAVKSLVPAHLSKVKARKDNLVPKTMAAVKERLEKEIHHWSDQAKILEREVEPAKGMVELQLIGGSKIMANVQIKGGASWTALTKERSRAILPILVRQALAGQKVRSGDLGEELGLHHSVLYCHWKFCSPSQLRL